MSAPVDLAKHALAFLYLCLYAPLRDALLALAGRSRAVIVCYHRVGTPDTLTRAPGDFEADLAYFVRAYECVSLATLCSRLRAGLRLHRRVLAVTFDDGYRDNVTLAAPALRRERVPATFFVSTGYVGRDRPFEFYAADGGAAPGNLTWDDLRNLQAKGFEIGSHTVNHETPARVAPVEWRKELCESLAVLQHQLGPRPRAFAFPYGKTIDVTADALHEAREAGYSCALSADCGGNGFGRDSFHLRRIDVGNGRFSRLMVRARAAGFHPAGFRDRVYARLALLRRRQPHAPNHRPVVQVTWSLVLGGMERYAMTLASNLDPHKYRSIVCPLDKGGPFEADARRLGIPYFIMDRRPGIDLALMWRLYRLFRRTGARVVHTHQLTELIYSAIGARLAGARLVHTEHSVEHLDSRKLRIALRVLAMACHHVTAVGATTARVLREHVGIPARKLQVIAAGIEPSQYGQARQDARDELGLRACDRIALTVARLFPEKEHALLISAFADVVRVLPTARLLIAGDGPERDAIERHIASRGLTKHVDLLGDRRDVARLLRAADVFVLSSRSEGLPLAILEAMAAERPVVATAVGEVPSVIRDGINGRLVPSGDRDALAQAMVELLENAASAAAMGQRARRTADDFSVAAMVRKFEALYG